MDGSHDAQVWRRAHPRNRRPLVRTFLVLASLAHSTPTLAQSKTPATRPVNDQPAFVLGVEGKYGAPQRAAGGVDLFLPVEKWHCEDGLCGGTGIEVQATAGAGGWRVAGGPVGMAFPFWLDVLATLTGTRQCLVARALLTRLTSVLKEEWRFLSMRSATDSSMFGRASVSPIA